VSRLDVTTGTPAVTGQWVYPLDKGAGNSPLADKVSALVWVGTDRIAVEELDDPANDPNEGAAYVPARGSNPALLAVLNDNDFGLVVPIAEQLDVVAAPPACAAG
jgi:hypothetical protein